MIFDFRADMPVVNGPLTSYTCAQHYVIKIVYILIIIMIEYIDKRDQKFCSKFLYALRGGTNVNMFQWQVLSCQGSQESDADYWWNMFGKK